MYSVDNGSAKLIAETEQPREYRDLSRKERGSYHLSGSSNRPREVDESSFSYTDAAGMYRDTEPRWRPRRGSVDRGSRRPSSVIEPLGPSSRASRDLGPPPSTRGFDKIGSDLGRSSSVRDPVRSSSRERTNTYDPYANGAVYDPVPVRTRSTMPAMSVANPPRDQREDSYYDDGIEDRRDSRRLSRQFTDDAVETRGFGIRRSSSADRYATPGLSAELLGPKIPLPPPANPAAIYGAEPMVSMPAMPSTKDYIPRPVDDSRRQSEDRRAMPPSNEYIPRPMDDDRRGSEDRRAKEYLPRPIDDDRRGPEERRAKEYMSRPIEDDRRGSEDRRGKDRDQTRERDRDRTTDRDHDHTRDRSRDTYRENSRRDKDEGRGSIAVPAAAAAAGLAAGAAALDKRSRDKKYESDEDRSRRPSRDKKYESDEERSRRPPPSRSEPGAPEDDRSRRPPPSRSEPSAPEDDRSRRPPPRTESIVAEDERSRRPPPRSEPNAAEDEREQRYAEKDRLRDEERKKDKAPTEAPIDPDEEYRRRVAQQAVELSQISHQRSHEDDRPDSDRERRRRERLREESERLERRKGSKDDGSPPLKDPSRRDRDADLAAQASQQHNRYDTRSNSVLDRDVVQEPEELERSRGAPTIATTAPTPNAVSRDAPSQGTERRVTIVEPPKKEPSPEPRVKGILRKPTEKFPEHPNPIREGVAPLKEKLEKDKRAKDIPSGAKWTKIDRRLVNPQSLEEKGERFEERMDCVIVLRVLTKEEIQAFADRTREIRGQYFLIRHPEA
jgi:hypothetical protein